MNGVERETFISTTDDGVDIRVWVQPRASRDAIAGEYRGCLRVYVSAPPVRGGANKAVELLFSKLLDVSKGSVSVMEGKTQREKVVRVVGVGVDEIKEALAQRKH